MKQYLLLIATLVSMGCFRIDAAKQGVLLTTHKSGQQYQNSTVKRTPMVLPIEVSYYSETRTVEIIGDDEFEADVYLTDESGNTLASSSTVNTVMYVPSGYSGVLLICIETEYLTATGEIEI